MHACLALTYELKMILDQAFKAMPKFLMIHLRSFSFHFVVVYLMIYFSCSGLFVFMAFTIARRMVGMALDTR